MPFHPRRPHRCSSAPPHLAHERGRANPARPVFGLALPDDHLVGLVLTVLGLALFASVGPALAQPTDPGVQEYVEKMAVEHAADHTGPSPGASMQPAAEVEEEEVVYAKVGDVEVRGFLARPSGVENAPGVIVIHEWWGLNDNIRSMARQLAGHGYQALAVDLYGEEAAENRERARELMGAAMESTENVDANLKQAYAYLTERGAAHVGSIGWCFGGGMSLRAALALPDGLDAAVVYYGRLVTDRDQLAPLETPILGLFGSEDQGIPIASVREFESVLRDLGKEVDVHVYEGANHAFANPSGGRYDAEAATDAWQRTLVFFGEHLNDE